MKILIATGIYPPEIGGPASFTRELARELKNRGHEPTVVCYGDAHTLTGDGWPVSVVRRGGGPLIRYARYAWRTFGLAKGSDVVFLQGPVSEGLPGTIGAKLARKPTVMKVVGDYAWEIYRQEKETNSELLDEFVKKRHGGNVGILERIERWTARRAKRVVTPSLFLKRIVEAWDVPSDRVEVIYNTIPSLPVGAGRTEARRNFGVEDKKVMLYVGRLAPWKHVELLIRALADLPTDHVLAVVGDGPKMADWKNLAHAADMANRVIFAGKQDRKTVAEWYRAADVMLLPSGYEGFPHAIVEAVSAGLPCLVSDKGGNPETEVLFPGYVTVLPYLDAQAWTRAMAQDRPRLEPFAVESFGAKTEAYLKVFGGL